MLSWRDIMNEITECGAEQMAVGNPRQSLFSMLVLMPGMTVRNTECLYIARASALERITFCANASVIVIADQGNLSVPSDILNWAVCSDEASFESTYAVLTNLFEHQSRVQSLVDHLMERYSHNDGLQKKVDAIADIVNLPVSILDISFYVVARSQNHVPRCTHSMFRSSPDITPAMVQYMRKNGYIKAIEDSNETVRIEIEEDSAYFVPIFLENVRVGYMTIYESPIQSTPQLKKEYTYFLPTFACFLGVEMQRNNLYTLNRARYYTFIFSMVFEKNPNVGEIRDRLKVFHYDLMPLMYLVSVRLNVNDTSKMERVTLADSLKPLFRNSIYVIKDEEILFLVSRSKSGRIDQGEMEQWNDFLKRNGLHAGITDAFYDFSQIHECYQETLLALRSGEAEHPEGGLYSFRSYQFDALLRVFPEKQKLTAFCYAPLMKLIQYDAENKTEFVPTLKEYIRHPKRTKEICDRLFIHKNTLYKRLEKIYDIMEIDLEDADQIMMIQATFHILKYLEQ